METGRDRENRAALAGGDHGKKKISVGTWAYIWGGYADKPIPFPTVVKRLKELKFDGIELGAFPPHLEPNTKEKRAELKKMLDSAERCKKIVDNLMTFSRQRTPSKSLESINDIIDRTNSNRIENILQPCWRRTNFDISKNTCRITRAFFFIKDFYLCKF